DPYNRRLDPLAAAPSANGYEAGAVPHDLHAADQTMPPRGEPAANDPRLMAPPSTAPPSTAPPSTAPPSTAPSVDPPQYPPGLVNVGPGVEREIPPAYEPPPATGSAAPAAAALDSDINPDALSRPGGKDLEGAQTPTITIEKAAPPEIQVGKAAKFEIV